MHRTKFRTPQCRRSCLCISRPLSFPTSRRTNLHHHTATSRTCVPHCPAPVCWYSRCAFRIRTCCSEGLRAARKGATNEQPPILRCVAGPWRGFVLATPMCHGRYTPSSVCLTHTHLDSCTYVWSPDVWSHHTLCAHGDSAHQSHMWCTCGVRPRFHTTNELPHQVLGGYAQAPLLG